MTRGPALLIAALAAAGPGPAQTPSGAAEGGARGAGSALAHYGKWATGVTAVTLTALGAREHHRSAQHWDRLLALCARNTAACALGPTGAYQNPEAEANYQASLRHDRRARARLLGGQAAVLLTVGLFFLDMRRGKEGPDNIPFGPLEVAPNWRTGEARVGLRYRF